MNPLRSVSNTRLLCLAWVTMPLLSQKFLLTHLNTAHQMVRSVVVRRMQKIVVSPCAERTLRHEDLGCRLASRCLSLCVMFISTLTVDRQWPFVYVLSILTSNARLQFISPSSAWLQLAPSNVGFPFPARVRGEAGENMLGRLLQAAPEGVRVGQLLPEIVSVHQHRRRCHLLMGQFLPEMVISWKKVDANSF